MKIFAFLWIPLLIVLHVHASVAVPSDKPYEKKDTEDIEVIFPEEHRDLADYVVAKESVIRSLYPIYCSHPYQGALIRCCQYRTV